MLKLCAFDSLEATASNPRTAQHEEKFFHWCTCLIFRRKNHRFYSPGAEHGALC